MLYPESERKGSSRIAVIRKNKKLPLPRNPEIWGDVSLAEEGGDFPKRGSNEDVFKETESTNDFGSRNQG